MLSVSGLKRPGLEPITFTLNAGECFTISGPSGSGKSLLLRALADLDPNEGDVTLDGRVRETFSGPEWREQVIFLPRNRDGGPTISANILTIFTKRSPTSIALGSRKNARIGPSHTHRRANASA